MALPIEDGEDELLKYRQMRRRNGAMYENFLDGKSSKNSHPGVIRKLLNKSEDEELTKSDAAKLKKMAKDESDPEKKKKMMGQAQFILNMVKDDLDEALTTQQRIKRRQIMRRLKAKIAMGRKRAAKKRATPEKLKQRAMKRARAAMIKKLARGKDKADLSFSQRKDIEQRVAKRASMIARMAKKMLPTVRKDDMAKMAPKAKPTADKKS